MLYITVINWLCKTSSNNSAAGLSKEVRGLPLAKRRQFLNDTEARRCDVIHCTGFRSLVSLHGAGVAGAVSSSEPRRRACNAAVPLGDGLAMPLFRDCSSPATVAVRCTTQSPQSRQTQNRRRPGATADADPGSSCMVYHLVPLLAYVPSSASLAASPLLQSCRTQREPGRIAEPALFGGTSARSLARRRACKPHRCETAVLLRSARTTLAQSRWFAC